MGGDYLAKVHVNSTIVPSASLTNNHHNYRLEFGSTQPCTECLATMVPSYNEKFKLYYGHLDKADNVLLKQIPFNLDVFAEYS